MKLLVKNFCVCHLITFLGEVSRAKILKLLKSYDPSNINYVEFNYDNDLKNIKPKKNLIINIILEIMKISSKVFFYIFKKQQNCLSIFIDKTKTKKRWSE